MSAQKKSEDLSGSIKSVRSKEGGTSLVLRLQNSADRALHYISDVRALKYDPASRRLNVRLTDEGRVFIMNSMEKLPQFRTIDPDSEAEIRLELPQSIVRLAGTDTPSEKVEFEKQQIADATEIVVDIGWAEVPYYPDPRQESMDKLPSAVWQENRLSISRKIRKGKK